MIRLLVLRDDVVVYEPGYTYGTELGCNNIRHALYSISTEFWGSRHKLYCLLASEVGFDDLCCDANFYYFRVLSGDLM